MEKLAKIFETDKVGQILVKVDADENSKPEVRYFFSPKDMGVCSMAVTFDDSDSGWNSADKLFDKTNEEQALKVICEIMDKIAEQISK